MNSVVSSYPFKSNKTGGDDGIVIGNDVWIGIIGGMPARIIKRKCTEEEASIMNMIAWWDWDENLINERYDDFKLSIPEFINKYKG